MNIESVRAVGRREWLVAAWLAGVLAPAAVHAQIATDGTVGAKTSLGGPNFVIPNSLGRQVGGNLFQSFSTFNVQTAQTATFTSSYAGTTTNVIARVTGGSASTIDGLLSSTIPGAELWFINPSGIVFGANAQLNVPAGFHASTANALKLADGGVYNASNPTASSLTIANPSAFGFLGPTPAPISVAPGGSLSVVNAGTLQLVGGALDVAGAVTAPRGRVDLVAVASAGDVSTTAAPNAVLPTTGVTAFAPLTLEGSGSVDVSGSGGANGGIFGFAGGTVDPFGPVHFGPTRSGAGGFVAGSASQLVLLSTLTGTTVDGPGGGVVLDVGGLVVPGGQVVTSTTGSGSGGSISVVATGDVALSSGGRLDAHTDGAGSAGIVTLDAGHSLLIDGAEVTAASTASGGTAGRAGSIIVSTPSLTLQDAGLLKVTTVDGAPGAVALNVDQLSVLPRSTIDASTSGFGNAGAFTVAGFSGPAAQSVTLTGTASIFVNPDTGLVANSTGTTVGTAVPGVAGSISVRANNLTMNANSFQSATTVDGGGGSIQLHVGNMSTSGYGGVAYSEIDTFSSGTGNAGSIVIDGVGGGAAQSILIGDVGHHGGIDSSSYSTAANSGNGGSIDIKAQQLTLGYNGPGYLFSWTSGGGHGGSINLAVDDLQLSMESLIRVGSIGSGDAGNVTIGGSAGGATRQVLLSGGSQIQTESQQLSTGGAAGNVTITASSLSIIDSSILADNYGGNALGGGQINLAVGALTLSATSPASGGFSSIEATTFGSAPGGSIHIGGVNGGAAASVVIPDHSYISTSSHGSGNAGSIEIDSQSIALHNGAFISSDGNGGAARLFASALTLDGGAYVSTSVTNPVANSHAGSILIAGIGGTGSAAQSVSVSGTDSLLLASSTQPSPSGSGQAGSVTIHADQVSFTDHGGIVVSTLDGGGGQVAITTRDLTMSSGGSIRGDATGSGGTAGDVTISASNAIGLDAALITAESLANSNAGNVYVSAPTVRLNNASEISAAAVQTGQAGTVRVSANDLYLNGRSRIDATSNISRAGNVELTIRDIAWLTDSVISGRSADPINGGGNFIIRQPKALILQDSQILANSANRAGGNISIAADAIVQDPQSSVTATGQLLEVGSVLGGVLQLRSPTVPDAASRLDTRCTTQQIAERSSMIVRGTAAGAVRDAYLIANSPKRPVDTAITLAAIPFLPCDRANPWQIP